MPAQFALRPRALAIRLRQLKSLARTNLEIPAQRVVHRVWL